MREPEIDATGNVGRVLNSLGTIMPCAKPDEPSRGRGEGGGFGNVETRVVGRVHHLPHVTLFEFGAKNKVSADPDSGQHSLHISSCLCWCETVKSVVLTPTHCRIVSTLLNAIHNTLKKNPAILQREFCFCYPSTMKDVLETVQSITDVISLIKLESMLYN